MARTINSRVDTFDGPLSPQETINDDFLQLERKDIPNGLSPDAFIIMMEATKKLGREFINKDIEYSIIEQKTDKETADSFRALDTMAKDDPSFGVGWSKARSFWLRKEEGRFKGDREYPKPNLPPPTKMEI